MKIRALAALGTGLLVAAAAAADLSVLWTVITDEFSSHRVMALGPGDEVYWSGAAGAGDDAPPPEFLRRYGSDGSLEWQKKLGEDVVWAMAADAAGVVVAGATSDFQTAWVARYRARGGKRLWRVELEDIGEMTLPTGVGIGADGTIFVSGRAETDLTTGDSDVFVAALAEAGNNKSAVVSWSKTVDLNDRDEPTALAVDPGTGGVAVGGYTRPAEARGQHEDPFLIVMTAEGDLTWSRTYGSNAEAYRLLDIRYGPAGKWIYGVGRLLGETEEYGYFQRVKVRNGKAKKPKRYDYSTSGDQWFNGLDVTDDGKTLFFVGRAVIDGVTRSVLVQANARGKQQDLASEAIEGDSSNGVDVAIDSEGDVVVAGITGDTSFLRKYGR